MNLQEDIKRIQSLITEDKETVIKNMIDKHGLYHTINIMGGYDKIERFLGDYDITKSEKIKIIKKRLDYINNLIGGDEGGSIWIADEIGGEPIEYDGVDNNDGLKYDYQQIEVLRDSSVLIYGYRDKYTGQDVGSFSLYYTDLPEDILSKILKVVLEYKG